MMSLNLEQWLHRLETRHHKRIDLGLARIREVAQSLDLFPFRHPVVTVAGTNGKGSCVAYLEEILLQAGYRVGAYASPHLLCYNERIRLDGQYAEDAAICTAFERIEAARGDISLSYFEFSTLAALVLFQHEALDLVLLEVGLGARLDATNIIDADIAVITSIAIDHAEILGPDREAIGKEKAGVIRQGKPLVCGDPNPPAILRELAELYQVPFYCLGVDFHWNLV